MASTTFLLISPVFNEMAHIEQVVRAVAAQRRPPQRWVIVDDGSTDGTLDVLRRLEGEVSFLEVLSKDGEDVELPDRLAAALEAQAFNRGLRHAGGPSGFDYIGKLDGDIVPPPEWYELLLDRMDADPSLGIVGATLEEPRDDGRARLVIPQHHVHGAVKIYRRRCFERIGGMQERLAWDTIDETYARMHGFRTVTYRDVIGIHLRPAATADGVLRGRARHGECAWILHYPPVWIALRSLKMAAARPRILSGLWFAWGYLRSRTSGVPQVEDPEFRRFTRLELRQRVGSALSRRAASIP